MHLVRECAVVSPRPLRRARGRGLTVLEGTFWHEETVAGRIRTVLTCVLLIRPGGTAR
jgi:hypothetical protein